MWREDSSDESPDEEPSQQSQPFARSAFPPLAPLPHVVQVNDLYQAAYARALADHQLNKLFNPEYYI
jgi:hypothetical protein